MKTLIDSLSHQKLWRQPELLFIAGLLPLAIASDSIVKALGLGLLILTVLLLSSLVLALLLPRLAPTVQLSASAIVIAALTLCGELALQAWAYPLYTSLNLLLPLSFIACLLLTPIAVGPVPLRAGVQRGLATLLLLLALGAAREILTLRPPAALLLLAVLLASTNWLKGKFTTPPTLPDDIVPGSKRVRVTGKL